MELKDLFYLGSSFNEFINKDKDANIDKMLELCDEIQINDELVKQIQLVDKRIYILVYAETWCPDCIINLPALKKINHINSNIRFKILPREGYEEYMENYKIAGKAKIPTFIILNEDFKKIGTFIEMPKLVRSIVERGNQVEVIVAKRKYQKGEYIKDSIEEVINQIL